MNSRMYDNVPPVASNTVTIATSSTAQVRLAPAGQVVRPMVTVPIRQPVPMRKMAHDTGGGASTSTNLSQYPVHQVKEEPIDSPDYQSASTSSGPLIGPAATFQQYQRGPSTGPSVTSGALVVNNNGNNMAMDQPAPVNLASKVAEVFLTAGHAFQKLGDLTLQLHTTTDADESKWSEKEVDNLKNALTRFAHELDQISTCVANRTTKHIKNDIKRRHLLAEDPPQQAPKRMTMSAVGVPGTSGSGYSQLTSSGMISTGHAVQKRTVGPTLGKMMATRTIIPTRYTVASIPGTSNFIPTSTVVVNPTQPPSTQGMPQLQSQGTTRVISNATTITRVMTPQQMLGGGGGVKGGGGASKRVMTPTSASIPTSGALILEHND